MPSTRWIVDLLDHVDVACLMVDASGRRLAETPSARTLIETHEHRPEIQDAIDALVATALSIRRADGAARIVGDREVSGLTLRAVLVPVALAPVCTIMVLISGAARGGITELSLRQRFQLTPREAQVARLLCDGELTRSIATRLGISVHTVRRHTERVLEKAGVNRRTQLVPMMDHHLSHGSRVRSAVSHL